MALIESIEHIFCEYCHLATPTWRSKCIHCGEKLSLRPQRVVKRAAPVLSRLRSAYHAK